MKKFCQQINNKFTADVPNLIHAAVKSATAIDERKTAFEAAYAQVTESLISKGYVLEELWGGGARPICVLYDSRNQRTEICYLEYNPFKNRVCVFHKGSLPAEIVKEFPRSTMLIETVEFSLDGESPQVVFAESCVEHCGELIMAFANLNLELNSFTVCFRYPHRILLTGELSSIASTDLSEVSLITNAQLEAGYALIQKFNTK